MKQFGAWAHFFTYILSLSPIFAGYASGSLVKNDIPVIYNKEDAICTLGYDPEIILINESSPLVVNTGRKTLFFHGFGSNKNAAEIIKLSYGAERLPGDIVSFNFADAATALGVDTTKTSLGQWSDMKSALYVLKTLHDNGEKSLGIVARSRGGATVINVIAALNDKTHLYDNYLSKLGINEQKRESLITMLQRGNIILECPLICVRSTIRHRVGRSIWCLKLKNCLGSRLALNVIQVISVVLDYCAPILWWSDYRPWRDQAIKSAEKWNLVNIPTIVHFQDPDLTLGNELDTAFFCKLKISNGEATFIHIGSDGGHSSSYASFASMRNDFLKKYGASYYKKT